MNREQRRKYRKIKETETKYIRYLEEQQNEKIDCVLGLYAVAIGLAHHRLYGRGRDEYIEPLIRERNRQIRRIAEEDLQYEDLRQELLDKTGVNFIFG